MVQLAHVATSSHPRSKDIYLEMLFQWLLKWKCKVNFGQYSIIQKSFMTICLSVVVLGNGKLCTVNTSCLSSLTYVLFYTNVHRKKGSLERLFFWLRPGQMKMFPEKKSLLDSSTISCSALCGVTLKPQCNAYQWFVHCKFFAFLSTQKDVMVSSI